jgi:hypothetical protein
MCLTPAPEDGKYPVSETFWSLVFLRVADDGTVQTQ